MAFDYQRSTEEIRDPELPALTQLFWGEDMITAWGENLLPNGDDYIKDTRSHDRQIALYADATYQITDKLKAEVGLRFAWTHFDFVSLDDGPQDLLDNGGVPNITSGGKNETPLTPKFSLVLPGDPGRHGLCDRRQGLPHWRGVAAPSRRRLRRSLPHRIQFRLGVEL